MDFSGGTATFHTSTVEFTSPIARDLPSAAAAQKLQLVRLPSSRRPCWQQQRPRGTKFVVATDGHDSSRPPANVMPSVKYSFPLNAAMFLRVPASHRLIPAPSAALAVARILPSGLNATPWTQCAWRKNLSISLRFRRIPEPDCGIEARRWEHDVWAKYDALDVVRMSFEGCDLASRGDIPQFDSMVVTGGRDEAAFRVEGNRFNRAGMTAEVIRRQWALAKATVESQLADASVLPSGLNATDVTTDSWPLGPLRLATILPAATSQSLAVLSRYATASSLLSGLKVTQANVVKERTGWLDIAAQQAAAHKVESDRLGWYSVRRRVPTIEESERQARDGCGAAAKHVRHWFRDISLLIRCNAGGIKGFLRAVTQWCRAPQNRHARHPTQPYGDVSKTDPPGAPLVIDALSEVGV